LILYLRLLFIAFFLFVTVVGALCQTRRGSSSGQVQVDFVKGYFSFPIRPGERNFLTGNMGELRANHFHGGLDIRTEYRCGLPVYAAADGYIQKVVIESQGYGWVITMRHPNGLSTVYAHLQDFEPKLAKYIKEYQYKKEQFIVEVVPPRNLFFFRKGEVIAYSGNTGSSGGPHLHFEIRDSLDGILNPLLFGFNEIKDTRSPYFARIGIKPIDITGRVKGLFERAEYGVRKKGNTYYVSETIPVWGTVGLEMLIRDRMNDGTQRGSCACIEIEMDGKEIYYYNQSHLSLKEQRQINNHLAYDHFIRSGSRFQKCYLADGNMLQEFRSPDKNGRITILDEETHLIKTVITDAYGNFATLELKLKGSKPGNVASPLSGVGTIKFKHQILENTLKMLVQNLGSTDKVIRVFCGSQQTDLEVAYRGGKESVFLWDLRHGIPDSVAIRNRVAFFNIQRHIVSSEKASVSVGNLLLEFLPHTLFDTLYLEVKHDHEEKTVMVNNPLIPLQGMLEMQMKPFTPVLKPDKTAAYLALNEGKRLKFLGGKWDELYSSIRFRTKTFGAFKLATDSKPPIIKLLQVNARMARFKIYDNMSGIGSWRATVNGKFLLMCYEHKQNLIYSVKLNPEEPLKGEFVLTVADNMGNESVFKRRL
jgi:Peptidase family M23